MWYILIMNKDVIYIEPEDDITDIITKIESSKEKIVALVPPKKAGVFRSVVNIKLIAKAGATAEKNVVLVTTDPSIVKLAAATKIPVTKNLQTAPAIPKAESLAEEETAKEELVEESDGTVETKEDVEELEPSEEEKEEAEEEAEGDEEGTEDKSKGKKAKAVKEKAKKELKKTGNKFIDWVREHKKLAIFGCIGIVLLILVLIWALVIAPAATIMVGIRTTANNFSENVTFTTKLEEENAEEGRFYLEEKKIESSEKVEFEATGTKNVGEKASGEVVVYAFFKDKGTVPINAGSTFTISGLSYTSNEGSSLSWDGEDSDVCDNRNNASQLVKSGCQISGRIKITAVAPGTNYNISASNTGWSTTASVGVYSDKAMSGGTDDLITIVTQADIDKAKASLEVSNETENKEKLFEEINEKSEDAFIIQSSFAQSSSEAKSTPAVGEEVKEGEKPTLTATTTASVFVIDKTKVKEFITEKAKLSDSQKIYEINDPFIENFMKTDSGYTGKLKTSYATGPKVTESDIVEIVKGRGLGDAQHSLRDIDGISSVKIDTSFPWVTSIPGDTNKITVILEVKE